MFPINIDVTHFKSFKISNIPKVLSVRSSVSNELQNGLIGPKLFKATHMTPRKVYRSSKLNISTEKKVDIYIFEIAAIKMEKYAKI